MEKEKSQLPSLQEDTSKSPSPSTTRSFLDRSNELLTRETESALSASSMAIPITSTSTANVVSGSSTASKPVPLPATAATTGHVILPTTRPPSSEIPVLVPASESSTSPPPKSLDTPAEPVFSLASSGPSKTVPGPGAEPSKVLPFGSSSTTSPAFGSKPAGSYPFGPSIFATLTSTPTTQRHTFGEPSVIASTSPGTTAIARPPVFGTPSGFTFAIPGPNTQENTTPSPRSGAASAAGSASSTEIGFGSTSLRNPFLGSLSQTSAPVASQPAIPVNNTRPSFAGLSTWLSPGTTTGSAAPSNIQIAECTASKLVKELQAQIQPLKQRTLLEGLLSHLKFPDLDSLKDSSRCHVCLEPFLTGSIPELPLKLPCEHICGSVCILKWLAPKQASPRERNCPICRKPIYGIDAASEWNALVSLEKNMLGMAGKLQAMMPAPGRTLSKPQSNDPAVTLPIDVDIPASWGRRLSLQAELGHDEVQWRAWTHFIEELVRYVESADEWVLWYHRRQLLIPIINMITVSTFTEEKKKGCVWISRVIEEVPELYLPLHTFLDRTHPDYYLATPGEEHYRKTADFHARIEGRGRRLFNSSTPIQTMAHW